MLVLFSIEQFFNCKIGLMQIKKVCMTHNPHPWKYDVIGSWVLTMFWIFVIFKILQRLH